MFISRLLKKETVAESAGIVLIFVMIQRVLQVGRGIVFARVLGPNEYGVYTLVFFFIPLVATVARLGIPSCFVRYIPQYESQGMMRAFIRKTYLLTLGASIITTLICLLFTKQLSGMVFGASGRDTIIIICLLSILPFTLYECIRATFNGMRVFKLSYIAEFVHFFIFSTLGIGLVFARRNAESAIISELVALILTIGLSGVLITKYVAGNREQQRRITDANFYSRIFRFSVWFMISPLIFSLYRYTDNWMLNRFLGLEEVGIYSVAMNIAGMIFMLGMVVGSVLSPTLSELWEKGEKGKAMSILDFALRSNTLVLIGAAVVLMLSKKYVLALFYGHKYAASTDFIGVLLIFWLLNSINWIISGYSGLIEKTYIPLVGNCIGLSCNIILNYTLIPKYGIIGAAAATTLSFSMIVTIIFIWSYREGFHLKMNTLVICLLPVIFIWDEIIIVAIFLVLTGLVFFSEFLLSGEEKNKIYTQVKETARKYRRA